MITDNGLCSTPFTDWVCAPVEIDNKYLQPRLRLAIAVVSLTGHHVVGLIDAVIDVIHDVGELRFADGLQPADLEEVGRLVGPVLRVLLISLTDRDFNCLVVVNKPNHFGCPSFGYKVKPFA